MSGSLSGCGSADPVPGRQLDLAGTSWEIIEIDSNATDPGARPVIRFPSGAVEEQVEVETGCRTVSIPFALDTDGSGLSFGEFAPGPPELCSMELLVQDFAVRDALAATESWAVIDGDEIEFRGLIGMRLTRQEAR